MSKAEERKVREYWITLDDMKAHNTKTEASEKALYVVSRYVHVREVSPTEPDFEKLARDLAEVISKLIRVAPRVSTDVEAVNDFVVRTGTQALARYRAALKE